jgi:putative tributyrin esterase
LPFIASAKRLSKLPASCTGRKGGLSALFWELDYDFRYRAVDILSRFIGLCLLGVVLVAVACSSKKPQGHPDRPRLTPKVVMRDVSFHSSALNRDMQYRVILPASVPAAQKLPVVYLLHGADSGFRDWSNDSDVAIFAERGLILVMPEGDDSYYVNARRPPEDRYEDYIVNDLILDVCKKFPVAAGRANRAIVGVSMGGFGAVKLALSHPDLFIFAGGLSPAIDVPSRPYSIRRIQQSRHYTSIFGDFGTVTRRKADPFLLARSADPVRMPYLFLTCGEQEGLLAPNRNFAALLGQQRFQYEFHVVPGGHNWNQWNEQLPSVFQSLFQHMGVN